MRRLRLPHRSLRAAFTLIEILVVVAIIALLAAILMPSLMQVRGQARRAACLSNLHQVHAGSISYSLGNTDHFPDKITLGEHVYRRAPGLKSGNGPLDLPETFGLAATLGRTRNLPGRSDVWLCPDTSSWMAEFENSYAFSIATNIQEKSWTTLMTGKASAAWNTTWAWDNFSIMPGDAGYRGPFGPGYTIPTDERHYPHLYKQGPTVSKTRVYNVVFLDGHAAPRSAQ